MAQCDNIETYTNTEMIVREDIINKAKDLAQLISTSNEVQLYQQIEKQVSGNERIQKLIKDIKKKQKEAVAFESFKNPTMVQKIEGEIDALQEELDGIPIVNEFKQTQEDLNYLLQLVMGVIRDSLSDMITVEDVKSAPPTSCSE